MSDPRTSKPDKAPGFASVPPRPSDLPSSQSTIPSLAAHLSDAGGTVNHKAVEDKTNYVLSQRGTSSNINNEMNVVAAYKAHFREDPVAFLQQVWAYGQGSGWRGCE